MEVTLDQLPASAKKMLKDLRSGDVLGLQGPLAAGKTTLVAALLSAMGYAGHVASPTFVLERRYPVRYKEITEVIHLDFYRLDVADAKSLDWLEHAGRVGTLTIIEWPERLADSLPPAMKSIELEIIDEHTRRLTLSENFTN